jgi:hypothetical protein
MLFCFGGLQEGTGPPDVAALRTNLSELLAFARQVRQRQPLGVAAYKPPNSSPGQEPRVFDFAGMIGLPLAPCHEFPSNAPALFLSMHALADSNLAAELSQFMRSGRPVLLTDGLARQLGSQVDLSAANVSVLEVKARPDSLLALPQTRLDAIRAPLLRALHWSFQAPNRVSLYLFGQSGWVVENFNDWPVAVLLNGQPLRIEARGWKSHWD